MRDRPPTAGHPETRAGRAVDTGEHQPVAANVGSHLSDWEPATTVIAAVFDLTPVGSARGSPVTVSVGPLCCRFKRSTASDTEPGAVRLSPAAAPRRPASGRTRPERTIHRMNRRLATAAQGRPQPTADALARRRGMSGSQVTIGKAARKAGLSTRGNLSPFGLLKKGHLRWSTHNIYHKRAEINTSC